MEELGNQLTAITGDGRAAAYFIENWKMERDMQDAFTASSFGERILGRKPKTLLAWMEAHRDALL